jgi:hypothetical protein
LRIPTFFRIWGKVNKQQALSDENPGAAPQKITMRFYVRDIAPDATALPGGWLSGEIHLPPPILYIRKKANVNRLAALWGNIKICLQTINGGGETPPPRDTFSCFNAPRF